MKVLFISSEYTPIIVSGLGTYGEHLMRTHKNRVLMYVL